MYYTNYEMERLYSRKEAAEKYKIIRINALRT
jgi:hypothetical protein